MKRKVFHLTIAMGLAFLVPGIGATQEPSFVLRQGDKVYIVDKFKEKWDVTQAESIGFKPRKFQHGIGKNAFVTLDDSLLSDNASGLKPSTRVIGISEGKEAKAYSIRRLFRHEISNSNLMGKPVAVGY